MSLLPQLFAFTLTLAGLIAVGQWIARQVQVLGLRVTGDERIAIIGYYLLMFPGIVLHELNHVLVASLLGLKVGKFSLGPRRRGAAIELGSVTIARGGALRDSLVGLAPFLGGTAVLLLVGYGVFDVAALGQAWAVGGWAGVARQLNGIWRVPDFWLWAYVIFAVSNSMTPSPADRQPWVMAGIYICLALIVAYLLGGFAWVPKDLEYHVAGALQVLILAFLFTLGLDLIVATALLLIEVLIVGIQHPRS